MNLIAVLNENLKMVDARSNEPVITNVLSGEYELTEIENPWDERGDPWLIIKEFWADGAKIGGLRNYWQRLEIDIIEKK